MKKIFALVLSVAMVTSMFVGVAFAAPTAMLTAQVVAGTVAIDQNATIQGTLVTVGGGALPGDMYGVVLQRRAPHATEWVTVVTNPTVIPPTNGTFVLGHRFVLSGAYRLAAANAAGELRNAAGAAPTAAAPVLQVAIGTVATTPLRVTPATTLASWDLHGGAAAGQILIPVSLSHMVGNSMRRLTWDAGTPETTDDLVVVVRYNGVVVPAANVELLGGGQHHRQGLRITRPVGAASGGVLEISVLSADLAQEGRATITVEPRGAFNAGITPNNVPAVGEATTFNLSAFNLAGDFAGFSYARATIAGPIGATDPVVLNLANPTRAFTVTPRHGGTITITMEFFQHVTDALNDHHNLLHTITRQFQIEGHLVTLPVTTARVGDEVTLRALVTTLAGLAESEAKVTFWTNPATQNMFSRRTAANVFTPAAEAVALVEIDGMHALQPPGLSEVAGEYAANVLLRDVAGIGVRVEMPVMNEQGTAVVAWITTVDKPLGTITVNPTLGYNLAVNHTLLAGTTVPEQVDVTVTTTAGAAVTSGLHFAFAGADVGGVHMGNGVWRLQLSHNAIATPAIQADGVLLWARNAVARTDATIEGSAVIRVVAPRVTIGPAITPAPAARRVTSNFFNTLTVTIEDPRGATPVPVARLANIVVRTATAPDASTPATSALVSRELRDLSNTMWMPHTAATLTQSATFRVLPHTRSVSIRGVASTPQISITVAGAPTMHFDLAAATLEVTPARLDLTRLHTVTVNLRDANAQFMPGINVVATGLREERTYVTPATGNLTFDVRHTLPFIELLPGRTLNLVVTPDLHNHTVEGVAAFRHIAPVMRGSVVIDPDTARPTIEVTAPSVTTDSTAMITIVVRDNVTVQSVIFEGAHVAIFPSPTVTITRTVTLREGLNSFIVAAQDLAGGITERIIVIERRTPPPAAHVITIGRANPAIGLDVPANVRNGRLMVPFRWFAERILNATVDFRVVGSAEIVTLHRGNMHVELTLNSTIAKVNGVPVALDVAAFATGGRTLVPARFIAETFGFIVNWNPVNDEVTFTARP